LLIAGGWLPRTKTARAHARADSRQAPDLARKHDDVEYANDRDTHFGRLDKALDTAAANRWTMVDMTTDWKIIFPPR
jgi:hypothetical protein